MAELADAIYFLKFWFNPSNEAMKMKNFMECGFSDYCRSYNGLGIEKVQTFIVNWIDSLINELGFFFWVLICLLYVLVILNFIVTNDSLYNRVVWVTLKFSQVLLFFLLIFYVVDSFLGSRFIIIRSIAITIYRFLVLMYFFKNFKFFIVFFKSTSAKKKKWIPKFFLPVTKGVFIELRRLFLMVVFQVVLMLGVFFNKYNYTLLYLFFILIISYYCLRRWSLLLDNEIRKFNYLTISTKEDNVA